MTAPTCDCPDFAEQVEKINGPIVLQQVRGGFDFGPDHFTAWAWCPWCGNALVTEAVRQAAAEVSAAWPTSSPLPSGSTTTAPTLDTNDDRYYRPLFDGLCGEGYWDSCRAEREKNAAVAMLVVPLGTEIKRLRAHVLKLVAERDAFREAVETYLKASDAYRDNTMVDFPARQTAYFAADAALRSLAETPSR